MNALDGKFLNTGKVGGWSDQLTPDLLWRFKEWEKRKFEGTGLEFDFGD